MPGGLTVKRLLLAVAAFALFLPAAHAQKGPDTLGKIKAAKAITVAYSTDSLPFSFKDKDEPAGYSVDLCKRVIGAIARAVGVPDLKVNWVADTVPNRISMVASGKADLECANTTVTQTRMKTVDFSNLIFLDTGGFLVRTDSPYKSATDLAGKSVAVAAGTTSERRLNIMLKDRLINAKVVTVKDASEGVPMVESGQVAALVSDKIKLIGLMSQTKDPKALT